MTMPYERTRAVEQAREFLIELGRDAQSPALLRVRVQDLLQHYPEESALAAAARGAPDWWGRPAKLPHPRSLYTLILNIFGYARGPESSITPHERARAVIGTKTLLLELQQSDSVLGARRQEAERLLRHFPGDFEVQMAARVAPEWWRYAS